LQPLRVAVIIGIRTVWSVNDVNLEIVVCPLSPVVASWSFESAGVGRFLSS
jgi:hypothetical protein